MVVNADERPAERQYLSKRYQQRMVYLPQWRAAEARDQQYPTKPAQTYC